MSESIQHTVIDSAEAQRALDYAKATETLSPSEIDIDALKVTQHYAKYNEDDHFVWSTLYTRRMEQLQTAASNVFLSGLDAIGLGQTQVPDLADVNRRLHESTGWSSHGVPGYLPAKSFFAFLAARQFPTTISIRPKTSMDYLPEPDIIHDVFGHVPLHADAVFADFLQTYGKAALHTDSPAHTERLSRLFWFTVEFGLIREDGRLKLYGSGLISSDGEGHHALESPQVDRRPFDIDRVCSTPFEIDSYQPVLYVLEDFAQLRDAMDSYAERLLNEPGPAPR